MNWKQLLCKERPRKSTNPGDHRAEFERDYDRTIFSTPIKRLQDKTQVFPLDPNDSITTRLTHSLEVSSVSRGLGIAAGQWLLKKGYIESGMERLIEAICGTCGLIHDLGNPPFGHSGEIAIRQWFESRFVKTNKVDGMFEEKNQLAQDFLLFDGNAQSLRLLTKLQILADFNGLNLTFGTLSASCKYTAASDEVDKSEKDHAKSKMGFFTSEKNIVHTIRERTGTGDERNPLTYLIEAADDIVYSVADLEDAVKKSVILWDDIKEQLSVGDVKIDSAINGMDKILKAGQSNIPQDLPGDIYASAFRTSAIGVAVPSVLEAFISRYNEIMAGKYKDELVKDCDASQLIKELKNIGQQHVYCTSSNLKLELMGRRIICDLMDLFWEGAIELPLDDQQINTKGFAGKVGALLSDNYRRVFLNSLKELPELPENYHRLQLVNDYVCGMTDAFAKRLHSELMNG